MCESERREGATSTPQEDEIPPALASFSFSGDPITLTGEANRARDEETERREGRLGRAVRFASQSEHS